ncbi:MAG: membrane protein insertion efficiency factor YidD [Candidatus Cloacimonadaceae bacterium]
MRCVSKCLIIIVFIMLSIQLYGHDRDIDTLKIDKTKIDLPEISSFHQVLNLYQKTLSEINGSNCIMLPSCSRYSQDSFKKYGLLGFFHTADRLIRCSKDIWQYHSLLDEEGRNKHVDEVEP